MCTELHLTLTTFLILNGSALWWQEGGSREFPPRTFCVLPDNFTMVQHVHVGTFKGPKNIR